jgi:predicted transcriptional regulator
MDTMNADADHPPSPESEAERKARFAWEAERIAEALASVAAGRVVPAADVEAWLDSLGTDHELPAPRSDR